MVTTDADSGRSLLEREENALARKRQAIKTAATTLEMLRRSTTEAREALRVLRELGFAQREITQSFALSRDGAQQLFPRRPRGAGPTDEAAPHDEAPASPNALSAAGASPGETLRGGVDDQAQQPGQKL